MTIKDMYRKLQVLSQKKKKKKKLQVGGGLRDSFDEKRSYEIFNGFTSDLWPISLLTKSF